MKHLPDNAKSGWRMKYPTGITLNGVFWQGWRLRSNNDFLLKMLEMKEERGALYMWNARKTKRRFDPIRYTAQSKNDT